MNWYQIIVQGSIYLKVRQKEFETLFKRSLEYHWIKQIDTKETSLAKKSTSYVIDWSMYDYVFTEKGDQYFREEMVRRNPSETSYYKYYTKKDEGAFGLNHYAPLPQGVKPYKSPHV